MKGYSTEYLSAIALVVVSLLKIFKIEFTQSEIETGITAIISLVAFATLIIKRFKRGGVNVLGFKEE